MKNIGNNCDDQIERVVTVLFVHRGHENENDNEIYTIIITTYTYENITCYLLIKHKIDKLAILLNLIIKCLHSSGLLLSIMRGDE
jgi:hypothetical protein